MRQLGRLLGGHVWMGAGMRVRPRVIADHIEMHSGWVVEVGEAGRAMVLPRTF